MFGLNAAETRKTFFSQPEIETPEKYSKFLTHVCIQTVWKLLFPF